MAESVNPYNDPYRGKTHFSGDGCEPEHELVGGNDQRVMNAQGVWKATCLEPNEGEEAFCGLEQGHKGHHHALIQTIQKVWWE